MLISLAEKWDLFKESAEFTKVIKICSKINYLLYHLRNNINGLIKSLDFMGGYVQVQLL